MFDMVPFRRGENDLFRYFDNLERSFFGNSLANTPGFRTDIVDKEDRFLLQAELPGFSKEDIKVDIDKNRLTISAERSGETEDSGDNFVRRERFYGSCSRSFDISGIDAGGITAKYTDGILNLELPKKVPQQNPATQIAID